MTRQDAKEFAALIDRANEILKKSNHPMRIHVLIDADRSDPLNELLAIHTKITVPFRD